MTGRSDETRSEDEIRADLALCRSQPLHRVVGGVYRGAVATADALVCLLDDVPALLADRARLEQERDGACEVAAGLQVERNDLWHKLDAARAEVARLREAVEAVETALMMGGQSEGVRCRKAREVLFAATGRCPHGRTEAHAGISGLGLVGIDCPGPAAAREVV